VIDAATARALCTSLALCPALSFPAYCAEPLAGVARIGILAPQTNPGAEGVREGLRELGYVEGRNVVFESPQFDGTTEQASRLADDLVRSKVDVIAAGSTAAARAAMQATATIPVVFVGLGDPVWSGLASSLSKPSRNGTGLSVLACIIHESPSKYAEGHDFVVGKA
jgi:putative ABC transport system substrate-binding protein